MRKRYLEEDDPSDSDTKIIGTGETKQLLERWRFVDSPRVRSMIPDLTDLESQNDPSCEPSTRHNFQPREKSWFKSPEAEQAAMNYLEKHTNMD